MAASDETGSEKRVLAGRYRLDEARRRDASSDAFLGWDLTKEVAVAIEIFHVEGSSRRERITREVKRAMQVKHPGLTEVLDLGKTDDGEPFVVLEAVEGGERLSERLARGEKLEASIAADIATHICAALAAAHDAGVVHRDLGPSHVTVLPNHVIKVHGLGLPHPSAGPTEDPYASPEHRRGEPVGRRADVYSIGAMLHAMLTGAPPGEGAPKIEGPLAEVVARCIAIDPRERYVDTGELEDALLGAIAPPGSIPPPSGRNQPVPQLYSEPPKHGAPPEARSVPPEPKAASKPPAGGASSKPPVPVASSKPPAPVVSSKPPAGPSKPPSMRPPARPPAAPPPRALTRPLTERPKWEEVLLDLRDGPIPRVALAMVLAFVGVRFFQSGFVPFLAALVAGAGAYAVWHVMRPKPPAA